MSIVIYSLPNMLTLPYQIEGSRGQHTFKPGKNQVPDKVWSAIVSQNKTRFDNYYSGILREFKPAPEAIKAQETTSGEVLVDISKIDVQQALDLIENTMNLEELEVYLYDEKQRQKPRKAVVKAIETRIDQVNNFTAKIKEKKAEAEVR